MLEAHADTRTIADTQARIVFGRRCLPWSETELATLRALAPRATNRGTLERLFPDRTLKATKKQLSKVREEMGCLRSNALGPRCAGPTTLDPDDEGYDTGEERTWRRQCERANVNFIAAMQRAGLRLQHA